MPVLLLIPVVDSCFRWLVIVIDSQDFAGRVFLRVSAGRNVLKIDFQARKLLRRPILVMKM